MINARNDKLLIAGGAAKENIYYMGARDSDDQIIDIRTKVLDMGNSESLKNLLEVAVSPS